MNTYRIHQKIKTPAHLFDRELLCEGYTINPFSKKGFHGGDLLIRKDEVAMNWKEAYGRFSEGLNPILDAISVVTQCAVLSTAFGSFFIYRVRENEKAVFFYHARDSETTGMPIEQDEIDDVGRLLHQKEDVRLALRYFRQANTSSTPTSYFAMLIIAAEALAGETEIEKQCEKCGNPYHYKSTDKDRLKQIVGKDLYHEIYEKQLRNQLFHGGHFDEKEVARIAEQMHKQTLFGYLAPEYGLKSIHEIAGAPRFLTFEKGAGFVELPENMAPDLEALEAMIDKLTLIEEPQDY